MRTLKGPEKIWSVLIFPLYGVSEGEERKRKLLKFSWRNYCWNFSIPEEETETHTEITESPKQDKHRITLKHIIKMAKCEEKETSLKAVREYKRDTPKGYQLIFQQKLCKPEGSGKIYIFIYLFLSFFLFFFNLFFFYL